MPDSPDQLRARAEKCSRLASLLSPETPIRAVMEAAAIVLLKEAQLEDKRARSRELGELGRAADASAACFADEVRQPESRD